MRVFYINQNNEVECIDTIDTPLFISCRDSEVNFLKATEDETDSFCIPADTDSCAINEKTNEFIQDVYILASQLDYDYLTNMTNIPE